MKRFLFSLMLFCIIMALILVAGMLLPPTPKASGSLLFAQIHKDSLLQNEKSPRIIFVGGSNLSFGLNSKMFKDSLHLNPINTGISAALGLKYMMDNTLLYVRSGDMVVVAPEYEQFYGELAYGGGELLTTVIDVDSLQLSRLSKKQWLNLLRYIPKYSSSKFNPDEYASQDKNLIYAVNSFNEYGDVYKHWDLKREEFKPFGEMSDKFNYAIIADLLDFKRKVTEKGALLLITFPGFQSVSFENNRKEIRQIETELAKNGFVFLGSPERYKMPDSLMYNTPYHLVKEGVDYRTNLLIEDVKKYMGAERIHNLALKDSGLRD